MTSTVTNNNHHHLETIDYKPPAPPVSSSPLGDEKKMDDSHHDNDNNNNNDDDDHNEEDDGEFDLYSEEKEWDEGGKSHCGYSEAFHSTLMSVGESVHKIMGEPTPRVEKELKAVGNWFQEASYAARDLFSNPKEGEESSGMQEDAMDAVNTLFRGGSKMNKEKEGEDENKDPAAASSAVDSSMNTADPPSDSKPVEASS